MIKKVENTNIVPDDIKELLIPEMGEYVPIGENIYELKQFSAKSYFTLLSFISKYYESYNEIFSKNENATVNEFVGKLAEKMLSTNLLDEFMSAILPEIEEPSNLITWDQLQYLLGVIYKLNFLSQRRQINNMEIRTSISQMLNTLGLQMIQNI